MLWVSNCCLAPIGEFYGISYIRWDDNDIPFVLDQHAKEKFADSNEIMRSRKSKDRRYNGQKKKNPKRQTTIYKTLHRKLKIEQHEHHWNSL